MRRWRRRGCRLIVGPRVFILRVGGSEGLGKLGDGWMGGWGDGNARNERKERKKERKERRGNGRKEGKDGRKRTHSVSCSDL